jgi:hypothetical protein
MSPKQPSKQKRAAQNRNQRAARAARAANANAPSPGSTSSGGGGAGAGGSGGLLSRLRGGGSGRRPAASASAGRRPSLAEARAMQPPGFRAALSAVFAASAAIVLCLFLLRYPVDAQGELYSGRSLVADWAATALDAAHDQPQATADELVDSIDTWAPGRGDETVVKALWPFSLAIVLPLVGAGLAFWAVRRRSPSKVLSRTLYATLFGAVLTQGLLMLFIPTVLAVGVAMFQVRKAEMLTAAQGGVIDVDATEDFDDTEIDDALVVERPDRDDRA